jgi:hypothetical protein
MPIQKKHPVYAECFFYFYNPPLPPTVFINRNSYIVYRKLYF